MKTTIKILIAEDDANDVELLLYQLTAAGIDYVPEIVQNENDYTRALTGFIPDIILSDYTFPSFSGQAAFTIRESIAPDTPFIFISGTIGEEKSIELIKAGVTDYVLKDNLLSLIPKIARALREVKQQQLKTEVEQALLLSEKWLTRAQQQAHMGSWLLSPPGDTISLSGEACNIYGISPDQNHPSLDTWLSYVDPGDAGRVDKQIKESRDLMQDFSISYRITTQRNVARYIYLEGKATIEPSGKSNGVYGIIQDVTETVLLELELEKQRQQRQIEITAAVLRAQENERVTIATELHNNLNQILGAAKMYVELAKTDAENRSELLEKSSGHIAAVIGKIREISKTLACPDIHVGLFDCIKILIADLLLSHPLLIEFNEESIWEESLDENLQLTIFRIVQEQVSNIIKHAGAREAAISLRIEKQEVILLITDNGGGNDTLKEISGVGIKNIRSRAQLHNGTVTITSYPGKGYALRVSLPLDNWLNKSASIQQVAM